MNVLKCNMKCVETRIIYRPCKYHENYPLMSVDNAYSGNRQRPEISASMGLWVFFECRKNVSMLTAKRKCEMKYFENGLKVVFAF